MSAAAVSFASRPIAVLTLACVISAAVRLAGQSVTVRTVGDAVHVRATAFRFIEGEALNRLKGGRSIRIDFVLAALAMPSGSAIAESQQSFNLSYDLWEERFAVTRTGTPPRSISHLTAIDAEAWCLDNLTLPARALGGSGRKAPFWIRLGYRVQDRAPQTTAREEEETFTLKKMIEFLSRRRDASPVGRSIEAGPFRLAD